MLHRSARFVAVLVVVCTLALVVPEPSFARPPKGTVTVRARKLGRGAADAARFLRIVDAATGEVLLGAELGANGTATLRPPDTVAFAIATVARPGNLRVGVSRLFRLDPSKRLRLAVPLKPVKTDATELTPRRGGIRSLAIPGAPVATMGHVTVSSGGYATSIGNSLLVPLFNQTNDLFTWVESSTEFVIRRARELDLRRDGRTDRLDFDDHRIPPDLQIEGDIMIDADGNVTGEITIVDPNTGEVLERIPIDTTAENLHDALAEIARRIAERMRQRASTTTTTTTTTTTSSNSSSTTPASTTPTSTNPPPPTTTTLPPPADCTSILPASYCECSGGNHMTCTTHAYCASIGQGTCIDHVGHTKVTFAFAGQGGRLGAVQIATPEDDDFNDGLFDFNNGQGVGVLGGCGTPAFTQGTVPPLALDKTSCAAYYHPGTLIVVRAAQHLIGAPHEPPWCLSDFDGFSGPTGCAGPGTCANGVCTCSFVAGSGDQQLTISYSARTNPSCDPPAVP